jgi:hypothetical protein
MPTRTHTGAVNTDLNNPLNYSGSGPLLSTDDLLFNGASGNAIASANLDVWSITTTSGYNGNISFAGYNVTYRNGFSWGHPGTLDMGNYALITENNAILHASVSGMSSVTKNLCTLEIRGVGVIYDWDNPNTNYWGVGVWYKFKLAAGAGVIHTGLSSYDRALNIDFGDNSTCFLLSTVFGVYVKGVDASIVIGSNVTISGNQRWDFNFAGNAVLTIPEFSTTNEVNITTGGIGGGANDAISLSGAFTAGDFAIMFQSDNCQFDTQGNTIDCKIFTLWTRLTCSHHLRSSVINCTKFTKYYYSDQYGEIYMDSAQVFVAGDIVFGPNWTWDYGTSKFTIIAPSNVTSNGKYFFDLTVASPTGNVVFVDPFVVMGTYHDQTEFPIDWSDQVVVIGGDASFAGIRIWSGATVIVKGENCTFDADMDLTFDADTTLILANPNANLVSNGISLPIVITANASYPDPLWVSDDQPDYGAAQDPIAPRYRVVAKEFVKSGVMHGADALVEGEYLGEDFNAGPVLGTKALIPGQSITILGDLIEGDADIPDRDEVDPLATVLDLAGLMDVPARSSVDPTDTLRDLPGLLDLPDIENILPKDTLRNVPGEGPTDAQIIEAGGGDYVEAAKEDVRDGTLFGPNSTYEGELPGGGGSITVVQLPGGGNGSFRDTLIVTRWTAGHYEEGMWVDGLTVDFSIQASVQPLPPREMQTLPEGRRDAAAYRLYSNTELIAANLEDDRNSDLVALDEQIFEVISCAKWTNGVVPHFKIIVSKVG